MSAPLQSLFLYQVAAVVDESCLQQLFDGHVSKCVFGGYGLGRFAIVDFDDAAYRNMVLSQSLGGILLDKAIDEKSMLKALKRNKHHTVDPKKGSTTTTTAAREDEMSLVDFVASKLVREQEESQVNQIASIVSSTVLASMQSGVVASPTTKKGSFVHPDGKLVGDSLQSDINITLTATLMRMLPSEVDRATLIPTLGRFSIVVVGKCRLGITGSETSVSEFESSYVSGKLGCKFLDGKGEEEDGTPIEIISSTPKGLLSTVLGGVAAHREVFARNNNKQQQAAKAKPDAKATAAQTAGVKRQREEAAAAAVKAEEDGTHHITFEEPTVKRVLPKKSTSGPVDFSSDDEEEDSLFKANNIENNPRYTSNAGQVVTKPSKGAPVSAAKTETRAATVVVKSEPVAAKKKPSGPVDFSSDDEGEDSLFKANNIENNPRYTTNAGQAVTKPTAGSPRTVKVEAAAAKSVVETAKVADEPAMNNRQRKQLAKSENKPTKMALKFEDDDDDE
jgi:hypothetical protein